MSHQHRRLTSTSSALQKSYTEPFIVIEWINSSIVVFQEPTPAILKGCVNMVSTLGSNESMSKAAQEMVKECLEGVILKAEKL